VVTNKFVPLGSGSHARTGCPGKNASLVTASSERPDQVSPARPAGPPTWVPVGVALPTAVGDSPVQVAELLVSTLQARA